MATAYLDAGTRLRQAREQAGVPIEALAATLKVPVQRLQALEAGAYEALPDATFTRALALSVCRALKIEPAPVLAALPSGEAPRLTPSSGDLGAPMPRKEAAPAFANPPAARRRRWPWALAAGLLVAALLVGLWPDEEGAWLALSPSSEPEGSTDLSSSGGQDPAPALAAALPPAKQDQGRQSASSAGGSVGTSAPATPSGQAVSVTTPAADGPGAAAQAAPGSASVQTAAVPAPTQSGGGGALVLRTSATSWIQVTGSSGRVWLQRNVQPGETLRFDDDLPLAVVVGRADATTVEVRGRPLDLTLMARNNVARFEVR
ncbi:helix-turn-helix domain-containing protein [Tepidimonas alkaliphilus]|uniref:helix-turn-helix domain-containing protein n=1 Tax=Tepidimonas alkaliphilus TaxID=2588942 RepID=UPI00163DDA5E|nr:helix-turn-helix domain-containing protein [Tepidimonas alkaliphilus]